MGPVVVVCLGAIEYSLPVDILYMTCLEMGNSSCKLVLADNSSLLCDSCDSCSERLESNRCLSGGFEGTAEEARRRGSWTTTGGEDCWTTSKDLSLAVKRCQKGCGVIHRTVIKVFEARIHYNTFHIFHGLMQYFAIIIVFSQLVISS